MDNTRLELLSPDRLEGLSDLVKQHIRHQTEKKSLLDDVRRRVKEQSRWEKYKKEVFKEVHRSRGKP